MIHKISYCKQCRGFMIRCGRCGNNSCNGGSGTVDGKECPDCSEAHKVQDDMYAGKPVMVVVDTDFEC